VQLRFEHAVDLAVTFATGGAGVEDQIVEGQATVRSNGRQSLTGATVDVDLNVAGAFEIVTIHNGDECPLLTPHRARCTLPTMARGGQVYIDWQARFAEPGSYDVTFTAAANGDTASANDVLVRSRP